MLSPSEGSSGNQLDIFHGALLLGEVGAGGVSIKSQNQSLSFSRQDKIDE